MACGGGCIADWTSGREGARVTKLRNGLLLAREFVGMTARSDLGLGYIVYIVCLVGDKLTVAICTLMSSCDESSRLIVYPVMVYIFESGC